MRAARLLWGLNSSHPFAIHGSVEGICRTLCGRDFQAHIWALRNRGAAFRKFVQNRARGAKGRAERRRMRLYFGSLRGSARQATASIPHPCPECNRMAKAMSAAERAVFAVMHA